jgi:hypothetical protein
MKQTLLQEKYPIYILELEKRETSRSNVGEIIAYYREKIEANPVAAIIGVFDHYAHDSVHSEDGIDDEIRDARNILFCFGKETLNPTALAIRPRSIAVAELENRFIISFLEAPNPSANEAMESWTLALKDR